MIISLWSMPANEFVSIDNVSPVVPGDYEIKYCYLQVKIFLVFYHCSSMCNNISTWFIWVKEQ